MKNVYVIADNIFSPLGNTSAENFEKLKAGQSGIKKQPVSAISDVPFYAALFDDTIFPSQSSEHTKFEQLLIASIDNALSIAAINPTDSKTLLIISSTKGNISLLENNEATPAIKDRIALHASAKLIAGHFGFVHPPVIVSNACISGIMAIITAFRLLQTDKYENVVIAGADVITKFILSGFQSFQAISDEPCKPFDAARKGINLGEGAATIILSTKEQYQFEIQVTGGATSNDANHISGPSRTGQELCDAINNAIKIAGVEAEDIDFISAHGTATLYNDEMEANAFTLAGLQSKPTYSLKGIFGHTLGAAGIIETIAAIHALREDVILPTLGFNTIGVTKPINICSTLQNQKLLNCLKTASGFGGCNAALIIQK